ncbi:hypothetical protein A2Y99_02465 [Candidatus Gottesmanbacteria bacterium RBG_13_37_7]|uniref:YoaR-like putative peptidoglycan binding domain-containing protein n=1 Tax=Candidatus Gottesmanbacteria bacterium RBG_13_37_7 TaxID=1798369 RepID=A0A1F5YJA5_9BACT|nr:MAG: hypothetical protein A2Y99_02465 [Candidatus Gottesmanbacteria bacterium RBG_13_37_7]
MVKEKKVPASKIKKTSPRKIALSRFFLFSVIGLFLFSVTIVFSTIYHFEKTYQNKIYPGVRIDGKTFSGNTQTEVEKYFLTQDEIFNKLNFLIVFEDKIATLSAKELNISHDRKLSSIQAYSIGRTGQFLSDSLQKFTALTKGIELTSVINLNHDFIDDILENLSENIDINPDDALFRFENSKVILFRTSKTGRKVNKEKTKQEILSIINEVAKNGKTNFDLMKINLPVELISPNITTENSNDYGIKEMIGKGTSKFTGSIQGRVHNIALAASRIEGHLVAPNAVFSFNDTLGDVSAATGYQQAYIIKEGRTVLGDGGGVCQVSTTLFRAALSSGLPIIERHAHSYRVSYYEQDSAPGIDATVFSPSFDLKFQNNTPHHLLIQATTDKNAYELTFEIYGTSDGRKVEMNKPVVLSQIPPPPDVFQDDPSLPKGVVKQVDWKAWGAKVSFDYKVIKDNETIFQKNFFTNYQPWQAVFLRGIRE